MNTEIKLPADVIAELQANRKISAIKRLRTQEGIGLKEAKELVDAYLEQHPVDSRLRVPEADNGFGRVVLLVIGVSVIYGIYKYFF